MQSAGFDIIQSALLTKADDVHQFDSELLIVKPTISAGAYLTEKLNSKEIQNRFKEFQGFLLQPFLEEIKHGEISLIYLGEQFSHAVLKKPKKKDFRVQVEYGGLTQYYHPSDDLKTYSQKVIEEFAKGSFYARLDGLYVDGKFKIMELELIEPALFLSSLELVENYCTIFLKNFL